MLKKVLTVGLPALVLTAGLFVAGNADAQCSSKASKASASSCSAKTTSTASSCSSAATISTASNNAAGCCASKATAANTCSISECMEKFAVGSWEMPEGMYYTTVEVPGGVDLVFAGEGVEKLAGLCAKSCGEMASASKSSFSVASGEDFVVISVRGEKAVDATENVVQVALATSGAGEKIEDES